MINTNKTYTLYHGSKGGIIGKISPKSPNENRKDHPGDFGDAFYIGTNPDQAKGVCIDHDNPIFYRFKLDLSKCDKNKILYLSDKQWLYSVISCRQNIPKLRKSQFTIDMRRILNYYDIVAGRIADDRMDVAMKEFNNGNLSDTGLMACLKYIDYGDQFALKTQFACDLLEEIDHHELYGKEASDIKLIMNRNKAEASNVVDKMKKLHRRDGLYIDEIFEKIVNNELSAESIFPTQITELRQKDGIAKAFSDGTKTIKNSETCQDFSYIEQPIKLPGED